MQMMRVTPLRFTTLQCSQIGFTLVRTFTGAPDNADEEQKTNSHKHNQPETNTNEHKNTADRVFGQTLTVIGAVTSIKGTSEPS